VSAPSYQNGNYGRFIIDIDIGGTFTDCVVCKVNQCIYLKVETTPHDLAQCLKEVLIRAGKEMRVSDFEGLLGQTRIIRLSTSLAANIIIEHKAGPLGLCPSGETA
jgi:N-methylhydantoinase A/oxoprolinase/acetone carboxylase beta subunit